MPCFCAVGAVNNSGERGASVSAAEAVTSKDWCCDGFEYTYTADVRPLVGLHLRCN